VHGGAAVMTPIGHGQIKARMRLPQNADCVLAGEHSGHFFFRDFFRADSGMIAALMLIEAALVARERGGDLSEEVSAWRGRYAILPEKNFELPAHKPSAPQAVVDAVRRHFARRGAELREYAPGDPIPQNILRMDFAEDWGKWWLCARPSGNEPLLRLNLEIVAKNNARGRMSQIADEVIGLIENSI
jgi:phosphomannomutase